MSLSLVTNPIAETPDANMAMDEWLLARVIKNPAEAYIRLYRWETATITFGVNQREKSALDHSLLGETPLIRRVTGGRALYHDQSELTYCVAFNTENPPCRKLAGSIAETSVVIAEAIREFLIRIGIRADWVRASSKENAQPGFFHKAPCFASSAKYELLHADQKLVASAQRRFGPGLMQHGSIKLGGIVAHPALGSIPQTEKISQPVGKKELAKFAALFGEVFASHVGVELSESEFSEDEQAQLGRYTLWVSENRLIKRIGCDEALLLSRHGKQSE